MISAASGQKRADSVPKSSAGGDVPVTVFEPFPTHPSSPTATYIAESIS
jgi:hypothetical protein